MNDAIISAGLVSSVVTELFKFVPFLRRSSMTQAITAIVVTAVVSYIISGQFTFDGLIAALVVAFGSYKAVVEPIADKFNLPSQR